MSRCMKGLAVLLLAGLALVSAWSLPYNALSKIRTSMGLYSCKSRTLQYHDLRKIFDTTICHQPRASALVASYITGHFAISSPMTPLTMVWQGGPGVGKSSMVDALSKSGIAEVKVFEGAHIQPHTISETIKTALERCPRTIFVIDDADTAQPAAISALKTFFTGNLRELASKSIFIFIINIGLTSIESFVAARPHEFSTTKFSSVPAISMAGSPEQRSRHAYCSPSSSPLVTPPSSGSEFDSTLAVDLAPDTFWLGRVAALLQDEVASARKSEVKLRETVEFAVLHEAVRDRAKRKKRRVQSSNEKMLAVQESGDELFGASQDSLDVKPRRFFNDLVRNRVINAWVPFLPISKSGGRCCAAVAAWGIIDELTKARRSGLSRLIDEYFRKAPAEMTQLCSVKLNDLYKIAYDVVEDASGSSDALFIRGGCRSVRSLMLDKLWPLFDIATRRSDDLNVKCIAVSASYDNSELVITNTRTERHVDEL